MEMPRRRAKRSSFTSLLADIRETNASIRELRETQRETLRESARKFDREMAKRDKKFDREMAKRDRESDKRQKEYDKRQKELDKQFGRYDNRYGEVVEHLLKPNLVKRFRELGFDITKANPNTTIEDEKNNIFTQIDFTLEDGDKVIIVEAKSKLTIRDIKDHVVRMGKVKTHAALRGDKRAYLGAMASLVINDNERNFALKNGFYVIQPSGKTFDITVPEGDYSPKEW